MTALPSCDAPDPLVLTPDEQRAVRRMQRLQDSQEIGPVLRTWVGCAPDEQARIRRGVAAQRLFRPEEQQPGY